MFFLSWISKLRFGTVCTLGVSTLPTDSTHPSERRAGISYLRSSIPHTRCSLQSTPKPEGGHLQRCCATCRLPRPPVSGGVVTLSVPQLNPTRVVYVRLASSRQRLLYFHTTSRVRSSHGVKDTRPPPRRQSQAIGHSNSDSTPLWVPPHGYARARVLDLRRFLSRCRGRRRAQVIRDENPVSVYAPPLFSSPFPCLTRKASRERASTNDVRYPF
jgi:hypothetical protein